MKVVTYNILFGMKGDTPLAMAASNLSMHGLRPILPFGFLPEWTRNITVPRRSRHLTDALDAIEGHAPDILCLNEVLVDLHREEVERRLRGMGFTSIVYGICRHHKPPFRISLVLATKAAAVETPFEMTMAARPGGSGGAAAIYIPGENLAVLGLHLALPSRVLDRELQEVNAWLEIQKAEARQVLLLGDFNVERSVLDKKLPALAEFRETAFLSCPSFGSFFKAPECVDHIFYDSHFTETGAGAEQHLSDHKLVWSVVSPATL